MPACIHWMIDSFIHSFVRSFVRLFVRSFLHSFIHSLIHAFTHSFMHRIEWIISILILHWPYVKNIFHFIVFPDLESKRFLAYTWMPAHMSTCRMYEYRSSQSTTEACCRGWVPGGLRHGAEDQLVDWWMVGLSCEAVSCELRCWTTLRQVIATIQMTAQDWITVITLWIASGAMKDWFMVRGYFRLKCLRPRKKANSEIGCTAGNAGCANVN